MAKKPQIVEAAEGSDHVEAEVHKGSDPANASKDAQGEPQGADPNAPATQEPSTTEGGALGLPVGQITDPGHAAQLLKSKLSLLHTVVHNMGHYSTLAFNDVEALVSDIKYLVNLIRSKV